MQNKIFKLIEETLNLTEGSINIDTIIHDVPEWDSLGHIMIISALQEKLNIDISLEDSIKIDNVKDLLFKAGAL